MSDLCQPVTPATAPAVVEETAAPCHEPEAVPADGNLSTFKTQLNLNTNYNMVCYKRNTVDHHC